MIINQGIKNIFQFWSEIHLYLINFKLLNIKKSDLVIKSISCNLSYFYALTKIGFQI